MLMAMSVMSTPPGPPKLVLERLQGAVLAQIADMPPSSSNIRLTTARRSNAAFARHETQHHQAQAPNELYETVFVPNKSPISANEHRVEALPNSSLREPVAACSLVFEKRIRTLCESIHWDRLPGRASGVSLLSLAFLALAALPFDRHSQGGPIRHLRAIESGKC